MDASGATPVKSQLVHPVLEMDLPFIEGVDLRDFSRITVDEFDSFRAFRDFMRMGFLSIDEALNGVQSQRQLAKIGLQMVLRLGPLQKARKE